MDSRPRRGTTTERALTVALAKDKVQAEVIKVDSREQGFAMLTEGRVDAFASDRFLLLSAFTVYLLRSALITLDSSPNASTREAK